MKKWLSLVALCCAMAMGFGGYAPEARAAALTNGILALKPNQTNIIEKARYRCWWRHGYRRCGYTHGWRHRYWRHHGYGWRHRYWRNRYWRHQYYRGHGYPYRRHYYYNSYRRPYYRPRYAPAYGYCIGLCWW